VVGTRLEGACTFEFGPSLFFDSEAKLVSFVGVICRDFRENAGVLFDASDRMTVVLSFLSLC
jgi:hypothetical protein